jgi:membrane protein
VDPISPHSPEARLKQAALAKAKGRHHHHHSRAEKRAKAWIVLKRVAVGVYTDGFIHAGNLAYLAILSIFPFIIVAAAVAQLVGQGEGGAQTMEAVLSSMPPDVAKVLEQPIQDVIQARSGTLLWVGGLIGLWSVGSFIETIRDIIRRAYGVQSTTPFWEYRLASAGLIIGAVLAIMVSFSASVILSGVQRFVVERVPGADDIVGFLVLVRFAPALLLFASLYALFYALTPGRYRAKSCPKWPGALFVATWWVLTAALLPAALTAIGGYDLTYGSLAGVAIALLFFFLVGMGVVIGAELNAALAETPTPTHEDVVAAVHDEKAEAAHEAVDQKVAEQIEQEKAGDDMSETDAAGDEGSGDAGAEREKV